MAKLVYSSPPSVPNIRTKTRGTLSNSTVAMTHTVRVDSTTSLKVSFTRLYSLAP